MILLVSLFFIPYKEIRMERIRAFGENKAIAIVLGKYIQNNQADLEKPKTVYSVRYRFIDPLGLPRERVASVKTDFWEAISPGDSVIVYYAKAEPGVSRIENEVENEVVQLLAKFSRKDVH